MELIKGNEVYVYHERRETLIKDKITSVGNQYLTVQKYNGRFFVNTLKHESIGMLRIFPSLDDYNKEFAGKILLDEIRHAIQCAKHNEIAVEKLIRIKEILHEVN